MRGVHGVETFAGVLAVGGALSLVVHAACCRAVFPGVRLRLFCPAARLSGRVALYHSVACSLSVMGFAAAWVLLASGFPAWTSMAAVAAANGLALAYRALHVRFILQK